MGHHARGGVFGETVSLPLQPISLWDLSFFFFEGALQLLFGPSSEGIVSYVAVDLLCPWEDVNSGFFCAAICVSEQREWEGSGTSWTSLPGKNSYGVRGLNHSFLS